MCNVEILNILAESYAICSLMVQNGKQLKNAASAIERYARENIPERNKAFGEFMYHAELLRRGHVTTHRQDIGTLPAKYQTVIRDLLNKK